MEPTSSPPTSAAHSGMKMLAQLRRGVTSASGRYWCAMCKKQMELDEPVCAYMPSMCVNTPIPIETMPPGSTAFYERAGLFYPKLIQRLVATAVQRAAGPAALGRALARDFLADLAEWRVPISASPLESVKSFLLFTSGFDAALRTSDAGVVFYLMDAQSLWGAQMPEKKRSKAALLAGARAVAEAAGIEGPSDLHFMGVTSGELGRYYCAQCSMFFEFGSPRAQVTCPFMPQKCKFKPVPVGVAVERAPLDVALLTKVFGVSPKLYRRQLATALAAAPDATRGLAPMDPSQLRQLLTDDLRAWGFDLSDERKIEALLVMLGIPGAA